MSRPFTSSPPRASVVLFISALSAEGNRAEGSIFINPLALRKFSSSSFSGVASGAGTSPALPGASEAGAVKGFSSAVLVIDGRIVQDTLATQPILTLIVLAVRTLRRTLSSSAMGASTVRLNTSPFNRSFLIAIVLAFNTTSVPEADNLRHSTIKSTASESSATEKLSPKLNKDSPLPFIEKAVPSPVSNRFGVSFTIPPCVQSISKKFSFGYEELAAGRYATYAV